MAPAQHFTQRGMEPAAPIAVAVEVAAPAHTVWDAIAAPGNLTNVHPFCAANDVERWPGPGSRDRIRYHSGLRYEREALAWDEGRGYAFAVGPPSGATALATWTIEPMGEDRCRFGIEVVPFLRTDVTPAARAAYVSSLVEQALPPYVESVVLGVRHFVESGDPVARNQFGAHSVFSPA
ncbi:MAG: SRPBCC family protein [Acidimicrobiia bacterium]